MLESVISVCASIGYDNLSPNDVDMSFVIKPPEEMTMETDEESIGYMAKNVVMLLRLFFWRYPWKSEIC